MASNGRTRLIILELNEVPYKVTDYFAAKRPASHLARILPRSAQFTALTPDTIDLHPKVSWQTFHRGVPDKEHGILEFNQDTTDIDQTYPRLAEFMKLLETNGLVILQKGAGKKIRMGGGGKGKRPKTVEGDGSGKGKPGGNPKGEPRGRSKGRPKGKPK